MGFLAWATAGAIGIGLLSANKKQKEKEQARREKELKRINTPCGFDDGITYEDFKFIAHQAAKRIKRVVSLNVIGPVVQGTVESQSGITTWVFTLDFNDYGHITGRYWLSSSNKESQIPERLGNLIQEGICCRIEDIPSEKEESNTPPDGRAEKLKEENEHIRSENEELRIENTHIVEEQRKRKGKKAWLVVVLVALVLATVGAVNHKEIIGCIKSTSVGMSSKEFQDMYYWDAYIELQDAGFDNIHISEVEDLTAEELDRDEKVICVTIAGDDFFEATSRYLRDDRVEITYHTPIKINPPVSAADAVGANYADLVSMFEDAGFIEIKTEALYDVVTGWFITDGDVKEIAIYESSEFTTDSEFRPDAEVVITYHALKKNQE